MWDNAEDITKDYSDEKSDLPTDPHLALYWLMHFGFTMDERYTKVKIIIHQHKLEIDNNFISYALSFFAQLTPFTNIEIGKKDADNENDFNAIFLKRRAFLLFATQSYQHRAGENGLKLWSLSILIYPHRSEDMIQRMNWLEANLTKYNQWAAFDAHVADAPDLVQISLLSYVQALNPSIKK